QPQFIRDDLAQISRLQRVPQDVLAIARAVVQSAHHLADARVQTLDVGLDGRLLAQTHNALLHLLLNLLDDLLDAGWVDATIIQQLLQRLGGDRTTHRVKAGDHHHARRVVDDHVYARGLFERADVAAFAADDPALHVVAGNRDRA